MLPTEKKSINEEPFPPTICEAIRVRAALAALMADCKDTLDELDRALLADAPAGGDGAQ
jgi:hypothetical protein